MGRILIIDDSLTVRMDLTDLFEQAGHTVVACESAARARQALLQERFQLVVLDVLLPDADGVAVLKELKAAEGTANVPVILLSTEAEVRDRVRGLSTGAEEYVGKPYDGSYMLSRVSQLLRCRASDVARSRRRILIIDDSATFRHTLGDALETAGFEPLLAATGEEGLRLAADTRPDAVVVDGMLPGIDGQTVIRRMRSDGALLRVPCLLLTGSEDADVEMLALEAGADGFVRKGDDLEIVLARLNTMLRSSADARPSTGMESIYGPKRILAVDDSPTYLHDLAAQLQNAGNNVILARSGEEALDLLAAATVDCILLDLVMPGLSGIDVCQRIKDAPGWRGIPVIMLTAREDREAMISSFSAGADDFVPKSSDSSILMARLRGQLRRKQFEDEILRVRHELHVRELEAAEARANRELAETRAKLLADLKQQNARLEEARRGILALYQDLEHRAGSLQRASELKSRFISYISHEFRTPVTSILSLARILLSKNSGPLTPDQETQAELIGDSARTVLRMVDDLLDLAKAEAGKTTVQLSAFDVPSLFGTLRGLFEPIFEASDGLRLVFEEGPDLPPLCTDEAKVAQILRNLISNALKFTEAGEVRVAATVKEEGVIAFSVADTGIGIAPEDQERIFDEFAQLDHAAQRRHKGTGLGLPLSRKLAEALGGRLYVESDAGKGSTFRADIPIRVPITPG